MTRSVPPFETRNVTLPERAASLPGEQPSSVRTTRSVRPELPAGSPPASAAPRERRDGDHGEGRERAQDGYAAVAASGGESSRAAVRAPLRAGRR